MPGANQRLGAGRRLAVMTTWLQRNIGGRAGSALACFRQRVDLGMRAAKWFVKSLANDFAVAHDHAADHRVRLNGSLTSHRQSERLGHERIIVIRAACHVIKGLGAGDWGLANGIIREQA